MRIYKREREIKRERDKNWDTKVGRQRQKKKTRDGDTEKKQKD